VESFVSLDLELTPFLGDQLRIIEIGAVRFRDGEAVDSFSTLVNPGCALSARVEVLTGIRPEETRRAPTLEHVVPSFLAFLGDDPIVGQSINLDMDCLAARGIRVDNLTIDTFELASLVLPGLPSYDLGTIARSLGVQPQQEHRALGDAMTCGKVLLALAANLDRLSLEVLTHIASLAEQLPAWPITDLFRQALRSRLKHHFIEGTEARRWGGSQNAEAQGRGDAESPAFGTQDSSLPGFLPNLAPPTQRQPLRPSPHAIKLDYKELWSLLQPGGAVASSLPGFEERQEQLRMLDAVVDAFNSGGRLLVEAGTGTGKSLSYLLPALYYAVRNGRRVVVSTNTINLQDQLYHKDIPVLQDCLPLQFRAALLKGRANYLCLRRWLVLSRTANLTPPEILLLIKTLVWLSVTQTGDKAELSLSPTDSTLWSRISAQAESCALSRCPQHRRGNCFVARARRIAEGAHLLIVNHALLLTDVTTAGGILPEYSHLIVDEAHHLEAEATEQLGFMLSWGDLSAFLSTVRQSSLGPNGAGFLLEVASALRRSSLQAEDASTIRSTLSTAGTSAETVAEEGRSFFEALNCFLHDHAEERPRNGIRLRITSSTRSQPGWSEIEVHWDILSERLRSLKHHLLRLEAALQPLEPDQLTEREGLLAELGGLVSYLENASTHGEEIFSAPSSNGIYWISGGGNLEELAIRSAPLHVGEVLKDALLAEKQTVILTSATLTTESSFDYIKERLGLEEAQDLMLGSPFDYVNSTLLYLVQDIPEPTRPTCQRAVEATILALALALEGRTLVLFTSHAQLRQTSSAIRARLEEQGVVLLAHGLDGSRRRLLQSFKSSPKAVLMGTSSFWEGIDVVGEALSCLVIVKLPFAVPTDPVFAARSEIFEEPFRQYSVPQTILKLKQGFGRLIRSSTDRGVVVLLDSRVGSKHYGPAFLQSLPRCTLQTGSAAHAPERARAWLRRGR